MTSISGHFQTPVCGPGWLPGAILFFCLLGSLPAQPLDALIEEAVANNRAVQAARLRWEASQENPRIARSLPDPMLSYGYFFQKPQTRVGAQNQRVALSQKIPYPGKLIDARRAASHEALIAMWHYHGAMRDLILRVKLAYADLYRIDQSRRIFQEQKQLLENIVASLNQSFEAGGSEVQDVLRVKLERETIDSRLLTLAQQRRSLVARLDVLCDRSPGPEMPRVDRLPLPPLPAPHDLHPVALLYRQELQAAGLAVDRDRSQLDLANKNWIPDLTLGAEYGQVDNSILGDVPGNGQDIVQGFISFNIPIWFDKLAAERKKARKNLAASKQRVAAVRQETLADVRDAWAQAQSYQDQVILFREALIPQAEETFAAVQTSYASARSDLTSLLESERALLASRLGLVQMESQLGKASARLERAVGVDLRAVPGLRANQKPVPHE